MNASTPVFSRVLPPQIRSGGWGGVARWAVLLIALAVLVAVACTAYFWIVADLGRRQALASGQEPGMVVVPPPVEVDARAQAVSAPDPVAAAIADPGSIDNTPGQRRALCVYLAAELERLNHEFKQPLPPSVIDRIATQITALGAQTRRYGCAPDKGSRGAG